MESLKTPEDVVKESAELTEGEIKSESGTMTGSGILTGSGTMTVSAIITGSGSTTASGTFAASEVQGSFGRSETSSEEELMWEDTVDSDC